MSNFLLIKPPKNWVYYDFDENKSDWCKIFFDTDFNVFIFFISNEWCEPRKIEKIKIMGAFLDLVAIWLLLTWTFLHRLEK